MKFVFDVIGWCGLIWILSLSGGVGYRVHKDHLGRNRRLSSPLIFWFDIYWRLLEDFQWGVRVSNIYYCSLYVYHRRERPWVWIHISAAGYRWWYWALMKKYLGYQSIYKGNWIPFLISLLRRSSIALSLPCRGRLISCTIVLLYWVLQEIVGIWF